MGRRQPEGVKVVKDLEQTYGWNWQRLLLFIVLFLIAVPWYWRVLGWSSTSIVVGVPVWFAVAVMGSITVSALAAWFLRTPWPAENASSDLQRASGAEEDNAA
jgi:hypothetical protein